METQRPKVHPSRVRAAIVHLLLCSTFLAINPQAIAQNDDAYLYARGKSVVTDDDMVPPDTTVEPFNFKTPPRPLDHAVDIEPNTVANGKGIWMYANDAGRVRARVETDDGRLTGDAFVEVWWAQNFPQNTDSDSPTYFVNPTRLEFFLGDEAAFYFGVFLACYEDEIALRKGRFLWQKNVFSQQSRIGKRRLSDSGYFHSRGSLDGVDVSPGPLLIDEQLLIPDERNSASIVRRTTHGFLDNINLSNCGIKKHYEITYVLRTSADDKGDESYAIAFVGDPLDPDTGFVFNSAGPPDESAPVQLCDGNIDGKRFADNLNGTVTDRQTALIWQRCPLGFEFDDGGTSDELGDDRCTPPAIPTASWQDALQSAEADTVAGHDDWRLPNIKELESIVELACAAPAIAPGVFPDTPAGAFWSATPDALSVSSTKVVESHLGTIAARDRIDFAFSRAVRNSGELPLAPLPIVELGNAVPVSEGGAGSNNELVFPIRVSRADPTDITVSFSSADRSAIAGTDYTDTSGSLVIPAGQTVAEIRLPVIGDEQAEDGEVVELSLDAISANARFSNTTALGQINDDEPDVTVRGTERYEGDAGTTDLPFTVTLSKPATSEIVFEYSVGDDTATFADNDYVPVSSNVVFPVGSETMTFVVRVNGDQNVEGDERVLVRLAEPDGGNARLTTTEVFGYIVEDDRGQMLALNDTGYTDCAHEFSGFASCPQVDYPGQDAEFGRDVSNNDDSDGYAGMVLTKLDSAGVPLANQAADYSVTPWDCVMDEISGLMWEVKTDDAGLRDQNWDYSWYVSSGINDGGDPGVENGGTCAGGASCDTEGYVTAVNAISLCGFDDWRVPSRDELLSLDINLAGAVAVDEAYFPNANTLTDNWWTSTPTVYWSFQDGDLVPDHAWYLHMFSGARASQTTKTAAIHLRLVRTEESL